MIDFGCPRCGTALRVADSAAGQKLPCGKCGQRLQVPMPAEMRTMQGALLPQNAAPAPAAAPAKAGKEWHWRQDGKAFGPAPWAELKRRAAAGELGPDSPVWSEGMADWKPAKTVPNLFPKSAASPAAPAADGEKAVRWMEGLGVLFFGGLTGLALLTLVGFLVWRGLRKGPEPAPAPPGPVEQAKAPDRPLEPKEIFERCSASVARVKHTRGSGSGFLARRGVVVTNAHVVGPDFAGNLQVTFPSAAGGNKPLKATLLYEDRARDLAILAVDTDLEPLPLAEHESAPGERVVVIGSPGTLPGEVVENAVTSGELSTRAQLGDHQDWYQITAAINPGNSGGPVFNSRGQVIGVVTKILLDKQGMNYAVPFAEVSKALTRAPSRGQREQELAAAEHDLTVAFRRVGKSSCLYLHAMGIYHSEMSAAVRKGEKANAGLQRASEAIGRAVNRGTNFFFDAECRSALPRVVGNKAVPEATRQKMEELLALHAEVKDWYENPRGTVQSYGQKALDCSERLTRLFESLRLKLGVNEDPRLTPNELEQLGLR